jgi:glycosyltransferase involved in cell wall biosynthesis
VRIVAFSINPLFPERVMGGAPKHLQNIVVYLGELGHDVRVLCTRREDSSTPFNWHERVRVLPVLPFKQPFPQPYAAPAYDLAAVVQAVGEQLEDADRFYMHDGEFLFPYAYQHVPTVVSLRDNVYPETLLGGFLFQGDRLVLISDYARRYFEQTVGRFFPGLSDRIIVIPNGIDWQKFKLTPPGRILDIIPVDPEGDVIVLHPHRPEETKGIRQTIAVVDLLVHKYRIERIKTLVPKWLDLGFSGELRDFYRQIEGEIAARGLSDHFVFHDWIPQELMPEYYSLGRVTLALGNFVESFGNAPYESFGCGTPAITSRVSTHRELLPDELAYKVDFDDAETAAGLAAAVVTEGQRTPPETLAYLHQHYAVERQLERYAEVILNARSASPLPYRLQPIHEQTRFKMPVWCYAAERGIYHDFRADYRPIESLVQLTTRWPEGFTIIEAASAGVSREQVMSWYRDGYLYPS